MENSEKLDVGSKLNAAQKARIERNRLKAVTLKEAKLIHRPNASASSECTYKVNGARYLDSGGGFLIEEEVCKEAAVPLAVVAPPAPIADASLRPHCIHCQRPFADSYLYNTFQYNACDSCRDDDEKHSLITRTEAKSVYLLKDCDLDQREPKLRSIKRRNPHNPRWGEMRLYLHAQVEERALQVWGSEEKLLAERQQRENRKERAKHHKYSKELKELRMKVRGSLYSGTKATQHEHTFGPEEPYGEEDMYSRRCTICGHTETYEKI